MSTDWLDTEQPPAADDEWLRIEDPNAGVLPLPFRTLIDQCMRGTDRVMASDGQYMCYRPFNREFDKETNPRTKERVAMFLADGKYKHLGTYDEVQVYELTEGNPYRHDKKQYVIGQSYWKDIRQAATAACNRQWVDYHDLLVAICTALKAGRDPGFARTMWDDTVNQIGITIQQMRGPSEKEVNEGFTGVRRARGLSKGGVIATLNSAALQKVGFTK